MYDLTALPRTVLRLERPGTAVPGVAAICGALALRGQRMLWIGRSHAQCGWKHAPCWCQITITCIESSSNNYPNNAPNPGTESMNQAVCSQLIITVLNHQSFEATAPTWQPPMAPNQGWSGPGSGFGQGVGPMPGTGGLYGSWNTAVPWGDPEHWKRAMR